MPSGSEIRLARARRLYAQGELRAALALLEAGEVDERHAASVNELRTTIQRQLLDAGRQRAGFTGSGRSRHWRGRSAAGAATRRPQKRCPKCQYISFESSDRCRNCGYEFSLSVDTEQIDVKIAGDEPVSSRSRDGAYTALDTPLNPPSRTRRRPASRRRQIFRSSPTVWPTTRRRWSCPRGSARSALGAEGGARSAAAAVAAP